MAKPRVQHGLLVLALLCVLASTGCTVEDDLVTQIGSTRVFFLDSGLRQQRIEDAADLIQVAEWKILHADLDFDGRQLDMLFGGPCRYRGTPLTTPLAEGRCSAGVVIGASDVALPLTLDLTFSMSVRRAEPQVLQPAGDHDGDGILDDGDYSGSISDNPCSGGQTTGCDDNCVLILNGDQRDEDGDGIGDRCVTFVTGEAEIDSDADGVPDRLDNCVWTYNPTQTDTDGFTPSGLPDGIGDACVEQIAVVELDGQSLIDGITFDGELAQALNEVSLLAVDFDNRSALTCDWDAGVCELDPDRIRFCVITNAALVGSGCP